MDEAAALREENQRLNVDNENLAKDNERLTIENTGLQGDIYEMKKLDTVRSKELCDLKKEKKKLGKRRRSLRSMSAIAISTSMSREISSRS